MRRHIACPRVQPPFRLFTLARLAPPGPRHPHLPSTSTPTQGSLSGESDSVDQANQVFGRQIFAPPTKSPVHRSLTANRRVLSRSPPPLTPTANTSPPPPPSHGLHTMYVGFANFLTFCERLRWSHVRFAKNPKFN